jgi:beta-glucosidase
MMQFEDRATIGKSLHRDNRTKEQLTEALEIASRSDVIIAALGESAEMSGESSSRTSIEIYSSQKNSCRIIKTGKPVI